MSFLFEKSSFCQSSLMSLFDFSGAGFIELNGIQTGRCAAGFYLIIMFNPVFSLSIDQA